MKRLFIYYSDTGNGEAVASRMRERGYDTRRVIPQKELPKPFFLKILKGGFLAGTGFCSPLVDYDSDLSEYEELVIGSPIWNGRIASPINTVLSETDFSGKKVAFILYSGGGSAPKAVARILRDFPGADIIQLKEPKANPDEFEKLTP